MFSLKRKMMTPHPKFLIGSRENDTNVFFYTRIHKADVEINYGLHFSSTISTKHSSRALSNLGRGFLALRQSLGYILLTLGKHL